MEDFNELMKRYFKFSDCRSINADTELEFSDSDLKGIEEIKNQDDIFSLLVSSICPTIYGLEMVKV